MVKNSESVLVGNMTIQGLAEEPYDIRSTAKKLEPIDKKPKNGSQKIQI
jgi:hypothetical protein